MRRRFEGHGPSLAFAPLSRRGRKVLGMDVPLFAPAWMERYTGRMERSMSSLAELSLLSILFNEETYRGERIEIRETRGWECRERARYFNRSILDCQWSISFSLRSRERAELGRGEASMDLECVLFKEPKELPPNDRTMCRVKHVRGYIDAA
ncbi:MAG: hypothetical protein QW517_03655 [Thermofilaceae archaeon]